ncbi:MAG: arsenic transporter [Hyphomicrobiales bacterium]|nr:arsenic transporter [Hyphomicrobiales bacterium]
MSLEPAATVAVAAAATVGVLFRPLRLPEYVFACAGALALVAAGLLPPNDALAAVLEGTDVYLFLVGMMLLSEIARQEGLFDWAAIHAVRAARGSPRRLFALVYLVGTIVTIFLSNDATAVVLTPAVYAATKAAAVEPLPYLFVCAFIANAASFVLPISNPANIVMFGARMPHLPQWLAVFALPSVVSILVTYLVLRIAQRRELAGKIELAPDERNLSASGRFVGAGLALAALVLVLASSRGWDLGPPTFASGVIVTIVALVIARSSPIGVLKHVSWGVLPLVAGLFVLVEGLAHIGAIAALAAVLREAAAAAPRETAVAGGLAAGFLANIVNNLPLGLIAASASRLAETPLHVAAGLLIGVDLGPNLSVTGSLATLLWLIAIRREGENVSGLRFLKLGALVMTPALVLALLALATLSP